MGVFAIDPDYVGPCIPPWLPKCTVLGEELEKGTGKRLDGMRNKIQKFSCPPQSQAYSPEHVKRNPALHGAPVGLRSEDSPQPKSKSIPRLVTIVACVLLSIVVVVSLALRHKHGILPSLSLRPANAHTDAASTRPNTLKDLLALSPTQLLQVDIARMNLLCADGLRGSEKLNLEAMIARLDAWAVHVESETKGNFHRFAENPKEYDNSLPIYRMMMLATVLQQDFSTQYNPERAAPQMRGEWEPDERFFSDSRDVFIHGLIGDKHFGTCSSLPVLYVAMAQRLGYPVNLAAANGHLYVRYEDGADHLNIEATGIGFSTHPDEYYRQWPRPLSEEEVNTYGKLRPKTNAECLGAFLSIRAGVLTSARRFDEAAEAWAEASRYLAPTPVLTELVERARQRAKNERDADRLDVLWDEVATLALPASPKLAYFRNQRVQLQMFMQQTADVAAIENAVAALEEDVAAEFKRMGVDSDNPASAVATESSVSTRVPTTTLPTEGATLMALVRPPAIRIPAERVPTEYREALPPDLQEHLRGLHNPEHIVAEMWSYYGDELNRKSREATEAYQRKLHQPAPNNVRPEWLPEAYRQTMPADLRSQIAGLRTREDVQRAVSHYQAMRETARAAEEIRRQNQLQVQSQAPPVRIQIVPTSKGEQ